MTKIFLKIIKDFRYLCFALLLSYVYWLFFPVPDWFIKQFYLSLSILILGCIFSKQRLLFVGLIFLCLICQAKYVFSPNVLSSSLKQECQKKVDFISANFDKRQGDYLWLSKGTLGCGNKKFIFASATVRVPKHRFIGIYPSQKIKITQLKIDSTQNFIPTLHSNFTNTIINSRSKYWQNWKVKANYYLQGAAKPLYLGIALADRRDLPRPLRQDLNYLGIFHLFAISGLHIGLIFLLLRFLLAKLLAFSLVLLSLFYKQCKILFNQINIYFYADSLAVCLLLLYLDFIGSPITAIRAWTMLCLWLCMHYFLHWMPTTYILLLIAVSMLLVEPSLITSVSFQFSFSSVFALLVYLKYFAYKERNVTLLKSIGLKTIWVFIWKNRITQALTKIIGISFFINLFILPLVLFYFEQKNLLGFVNNLFHIPFMGLLYLPSVLLGFPLFFFNVFQEAEILYFALIQKLGDLWYGVIQKNTTLNSVVIEKIPFLQLEKEALNLIFWQFYFVVLSVVLFFYYKKSSNF